MTESKILPREVSLVSGESVVMTLKRRYPSIITSILASFATLMSWGVGSAISQISRVPDFGERATYYLYGIILFVVLGLAVVLSIGYFYVRGHLYVLTNRRIILYRKFVTISIREAAYKEITDIMVNQGPVARILNYGSITPLSPGVRMPYAAPLPFMRNPQAIFRVSLKDVSQPHRIAGELYKLIRSASAH